MACYEHINLTLMFHKYLLHMFVKTVVYTYMVRNHWTYKCWLVSTLCGHNYVCIYAYLCENCMMGRWPLCTINFLNVNLWQLWDCICLLCGSSSSPHNYVQHLFRLNIYYAEKAPVFANVQRQTKADSKMNYISFALILYTCTGAKNKELFTLRCINYNTNFTIIIFI